MVKNIIEIRISNINYFGNYLTTVVFNNIDAAILINRNPTRYVRVDTKKGRILMKPEISKQREIDGYRNLSELYKLFNDVTKNKHSSVIVDNNGKPGGY